MSIQVASDIKGRSRLAEVLPLDTPYVLGIFTGDVCNFHCIYCTQSVAISTGWGQSYLRRQFMDVETCKKVITSARAFPHKIKKVFISSMGEPLLNKNLSQMIRMVRESGITDFIEMVTNASVLTHELSDALIDAGLNRLRVSIQGITAESYHRIAQVHIDFEQFIERLKYFYTRSRGRCLVHIKTVDIALSEGEREKFFQMFSPIADTIFVDSVIPNFHDVNYSKITTHDGITLYGEKVPKRLVCPPVFYTLFVLPNGDVTTCCTPPYPMILGNIREKELVELWQGKRRKDFLCLQLRGERFSHDICKKCFQPYETSFSADNLDDNRQEILARIMEARKDE